MGVGASALAWLGRGSRAAPPPGAPLRIYEPEGGRVVIDPALAPKAFREAPQLADLVRTGRLPPVEARVGLDPLIIEPLHDIGRYGGTLHRAFTGPADFQTVTRFASGPDSLLYWDAAWTKVVPNIARGFEVSPDGRVTTLFLRRGMRWSDGAPFTADDVLFWFEDMHNDRRVTPRPSSALMVGGEPVRIERVDGSTVQFISPRPYHILPEVLASWGDLGGPSIVGRAGLGGFAPKHYLSQFHPKYVEEAEIRRRAHDAGLANWAVHLKMRNDWTLNPDLPVVSPWRVTEAINTEAFVLERNPYSIWVDTAGNQLPYIDRIRHSYCSGPEAVSFKAGTGELDEQERNLLAAKLPFLLSNRRRSSYEVYVDPFGCADVGVRFNFDYRPDPAIGALIKSRDFRRALSLGVDREAIIETLMLGAGAPSSAAPVPGNRYYPGGEWTRRWATYDPLQANRMLDRVGLAERDPQGFRRRRDDGRRLRLVCQTFFSHFDYPAVGEMLREQWRALGVDVDIQVVEPNLFSQRCAAGEVQMGIQFTGTDDPFLYPDYLFPSVPSNAPALIGPELARWFQSDGRAGAEPPPELRGMMELWRQGREAPLAQRIPIGQEMIRRHVDEVVSIGIVAGGYSFYGVRVVNRALGNVPRRVINSNILRSPVNGYPMTHYFRDARRT